MWECAIEGCGRRTDAAEDLLVHQATEHDRVRCAVCGTMVADGYFGIRHALGEHTRAQYVRAYAADSEAVAQREAIVETVEREVDVERVLEELREREELESERTDDE